MLKNKKLYLLILTVILSCLVSTKSISQSSNKNNTLDSQPTKENTKQKETKSNTVITLIFAIISGIASGTLSSGLFLLILTNFRPKIKISSLIAQGVDSRGNKVFRIKIINKTPRKIINIKMEFEVVTISLSSPSGGNTEENNRNMRLIKGLEPIQLYISEVAMIEKFDPNDMDHAEYACTFGTYHNLDTMVLEHRSYLQFTFFATDSISNFSSVHTQKYYPNNDGTLSEIIKRGRFEFGNSLNISQ